MEEKKKKVVFFTGSGISEESGLATFRNSPTGLWENYKIEEVCTYEAWEENPGLVLDFYNMRRKQCLEVEPNEAHKLIAALENDFDVTVITQNVDDLHERAGSSHILLLHGELLKSRSTKNNNLIYDQFDKIKLGDTCELGSQLRPHIVWFGEQLDEEIMTKAKVEMITADVCVIVGTSMQVYPANTIPYFVEEHARIIVIDPEEIKVDFDDDFECYHIKEKATSGIKELYESLMKNK